MNPTIKDLEAWLKGLNDLPKKNIPKETLLDIAGINHLENHWSYIYMYFFNPQASHGFSRLFIDTFQEIISKKTGKPLLSMEYFYVTREEAVQDEQGNSKRIDLLLQNEKEAIIIENKVYATLYNRLDLYWSKPTALDENKRGVVLSLWTTKPTDTNFINITHEEFVTAIEAKLPGYSKSVQPKAQLLLEDFVQNIHNLTHPMNEEELNFYFQNRENINRLADIKNNIVGYIKKALIDCNVQELYDDLSVSKNRSERYVSYTFNDNPKVMLTLVYDTLWNCKPNEQPRIMMLLELQAEMIAKVEKHAAELNGIGIKQQNGLHKDTSYWHYTCEDIYFKPEDLINEGKIADKIVAAIKDSGLYETGKNIINCVSTD